MQGTALFVYLGHALKQLGVQVDRILHGGQFRRLCLLNLFERWVNICAGHSVEDIHDAVDETAALFHRDKGIFKRWFGRIVGNDADLIELLCDASLDRRLVVGILDLVERRCLKGQGARCVERVAGAKACNSALAEQVAGCERESAGSDQSGNLQEYNPHFAQLGSVHDRIFSLRSTLLYKPRMLKTSILDEETAQLQRAVGRIHRGCVPCLRKGCKKDC